MKTLFFYTKKNVFEISKSEDGKLVFFPENPDAGSLIMSNGGREQFLAKCVEKDMTYDEVKAEFDAEKKKAEEAKKAEHLAKSQQIQDEIVSSYRNLLAKYGIDMKNIDQSKKIDATAENLYIIMRYLRTINWGLWRLPALTQGYSANQYECGNGNTTVTVILDKGIANDEGKLVKKFQYGAPSNYLVKYTNIGRAF